MNKSFDLFFYMNTYNSEVRNEMIGFVTLSIAIITFSDKFKNKAFMVIAGFATLFITIINSSLLMTHFWNYLMNAPESDLPPYVSRVSLFISQVMRFVYVFIIMAITFEISTSKLWPF